MRRPISRTRLTVAASGFALFLAACEEDKTPNQTGAAGTTGTAGSGGSPAGAAGTGGSPAGAGGTAGSAAGAGGTGGATAGTGGGGGTAGTGGAPFIDTDVVLARFNANGTLDTTFGTQGVARVDLGTGAPVGGRDAPWGIAKDDQDRLHVFAARKNTDGRTDADRVVARLSPNGALDRTFGDAIPMQTTRTGIHTLNIGNLSDNVRNGFVQPDGKIVTSGYYGQPSGVGSQTANRLVLARIHGGDAPVTAGTGGGSTGGGAAGGAGGAAGGAGGAAGGAGGATGGTGGAAAGGAGGAIVGAGGAAGGAGGATGGTGGGAAGGTGGGTAPQPGTFDTTFGVGGIASANPFSSTDPSVMWGQAEAYGVTRQSSGAYITTGYGRLAPSGQVNVLSFRFTAAGVFDTTWATNGIFERDLTSDNDRGRNIVTLPQDRIMMVGSATPATNNVDGMIMILTPNGALDTTFNTTGYKIYKFDAASDRADESLYGAAVSPDGMFAVAAGYRNSPRPATTAVNDDAVLVILPLGGTGTEFVGVVPFSTTADDRFWAVTFDKNNKIVATGYVTEGADNFLAVARFNTDGSRDTSFGTGGIAKVNAIVGGNLEEARGVVVQSNDKIVIGGAAEH